MSNAVQLDGGSTRKAHPLPPKIAGWESLHLTFRHAKLPELPIIHHPEIWSVLKSRRYEQPIGVLGHSIQTLAWMGDAVLYLASTKACLKAGLKSQKCKQLGSIRGGLTTNRTFSYLTLTYRIHDLLGQTPFTDQKRYADFFEAYIGAAWVSASETKDPVHIREIEDFLSQLFKPRIWPALESLMEGSAMDLSTTVQFDQSLGDVSRDDDVSVFAIPPPRLAPTKKMLKKAFKDKRKKRTDKLADITERNRQHALVNRLRENRFRENQLMTSINHREAQYSTPIKTSSSGNLRPAALRDRSSERKRQSAITNRVAKKLSARSLHSHATPIRSGTSTRSIRSRPSPGPSSKVYRLNPGNSAEEEVDLNQDSDWEDIKIVPGPVRLTRTDRYIGSRGSTSAAPIVVD